jgi:hypothetical protein
VVAVLVAVLFVGGATVVLNARHINRSDRLIYPDDGLHHSSVWIGLSGKFTASVSLELRAEPDQIDVAALVERALHKVGVHGFQTNEDDVQGWTRLSVIDLQIGVKISRRSNGTVLFTVSGRPRYSTTTMAYRRHQKIVRLAAQAISDEWTATVAGTT